jgi:hypothetical protein
VALKLPDNGGRRLGVDRRQFSYDFHIPERRSGKDRRSGNDIYYSYLYKFFLKYINEGVANERATPL